MMSKLDDMQNKHVELYTSLFSESQYEYGSTKKPFKANSIKGKSTKATKISLLKEATKKPTKNNSLKEKAKTPPKVSSTKRRKERRKTKHKKELKTRLDANKKHIKNLSDKKLTNDQINLLAKG